MSWRAWIAFVTLGVLWGVPYFFIKLSLTELSPWVVAFGRVSLAALVVLPIAWHRGALSSLGRHKAPVTAFALAEFAIPFAAIAVAERWIDSSVTGILIALVPIFVTLLARTFGLEERLGLTRAFGLALGLTGVVSLLGFGTLAWPYGWFGVGLMIVATLGYAIGPLVLQRHLAGIDPVGPVALSLAIASLALLVPALITLPTHVPSRLTLASMGILGVVCTAAATFLLFYLVAQAGAARALVVSYVNPAVATLLGVLVLHEQLGRGGAAAFAFILIGSWLAARGPKPPALGAAAAPAEIRRAT